MKLKIILLISTILVIFAACRATKNSTTTSIQLAPVSTAGTTIAVNNSPSPKSTNGVYPPGNEELTAIQTKYKDVTLNRLMEGYSIYTMGECINCHAAQNIYNHNEIQWKDIIEDMAIKANISNAQKDAVYKYVLAIKATQLK